MAVEVVESDYADCQRLTVLRVCVCVGVFKCCLNELFGDTSRTRTLERLELCGVFAAGL